MQYHDATILAAQHDPPRYDPEDSEKCLDAYVVHIFPHLNKAQYKRPFQRDTATTLSRSPNKRQKRSAAGPTETQTPAAGSGTCSVHPYGSHSSADCKVLKQRKEAKGKQAGKKRRVKSEPKSDSENSTD